MKRNKYSFQLIGIISSLIYIIANNYISSARAEFQFGGYYKNYTTFIDFTNNNEPLAGAVVNRLRCNLSYAPTDRLSFAFAYDFSPRIQNTLLFSDSLSAVSLPSSRYRLVDFASQIYPDVNDMSGNVGIFHNLDRLSIHWSATHFDVILGRDAVAWGSARVINPTDVISPFTYDQLDTEDRIGVDAIRLRIPIGVLGEIDTGYIFGENFNYDKSALFFRSTLNAIETDFSLSILEFQRDRLIGFDISRGIAGAGFWFETAYVLVDSQANNSELKEKYTRTSIGLDYSFSGETYGFVEYHYNGAGVQNPKDYLTNISHPAYTHGGVFLLGKHYLVPGISYLLTPLLSFSGQILLNINDYSFWISPNIIYNIAQDIHISAGSFFSIGKRSKDSISTQFLSEFGAYPHFLYSSIQIYY